MIPEERETTMEQPGWFSDPGRDEVPRCECGCDLEFGQQLDERDRCEACSEAGCYASCCKRPWTMTVDWGDEEKLESFKLTDALSESQSRVLSRWDWYSNYGEENFVTIKLYDGRREVKISCAPVVPVSP